MDIGSWDIGTYSSHSRPILGALGRNLLKLPPPLTSSANIGPYNIFHNAHGGLIRVYASLGLGDPDGYFRVTTTAASLQTRHPVTHVYWQVYIACDLALPNRQVSPVQGSIAWPVRCDYGSAVTCHNRRLWRNTVDANDAIASTTGQRGCT